jgi:hypothetical protein
MHAAEDRLKQKRAAADSNLNTLGANILSTDRTGINDYISGARTDDGQTLVGGLPLTLTLTRLLRRARWIHTRAALVVRYVMQLVTRSLLTSLT